ncbi:ABC transporter ATP-binding protein [Alkalibacter mobilis]|uniref:ABC transporter ATP-binding protein n=1 Tax=Alkalibacter mobilis TaxID=2787712 RepID=UPI00189DC780|nr:dipeptide/oligopeptide/nickel ABC transporter ATP-binding protein [Alkalibacter mobilis]MBF7096789.1 ABC transporter ATP-binding protein [Alkalibacter mobilis]
MDNKLIFRGDKISKHYGTPQNKVLKEVSFEIYESECVGFVGESGCGKSTLARIITHLTQANGGDFFLKEKLMTNLSKIEKKEYYKKVQMIFQDPLSTFSPRMKINEYLLEPFINFKLSNRKGAQISVDKIMNSMKLPLEYLNKYPHELSGGELQRIVIARAVLLDPELIICDEATSALDVTTQKQIITLLKDIQKERSFSIMFITHNLALAEQICNKIYVMKNGKILEEIGTKSIIKDAKHLYTRQFFTAGRLGEKFCDA